MDTTSHFIVEHLPVGMRMACGVVLTERGTASFKDFTCIKCSRALRDAKTANPAYWLDEARKLSQFSTR